MGSRFALELGAVVKTVAPGRAVLDGASLRVARGEVVGVAGAPGSGKTLLLHVASGLEAADAGAVRWFGGREPPARGVALVPAGAPALLFLTVRETLAVAAEQVDLAGRTPLDPLMAADAMGLRGALASRIRQLSPPLRVRVAIARALVAGPRLLLVDAPIDAWEPAARRDLRDCLRPLADGGLAVVLTARGVPALAGVAGRAALLAEGRIGAVVDPWLAVHGRRPPARVAERG